MAASTALEEARALRRVSARRFPALLAAAGLAGMGLVTAGPRRAEAAYTTGTAPDGGDLVNTHLTVQGNLTVSGTKVGIGTTNPDGVQVTVPATETPRGVDNVRFGVIAGTPRVLLEDAESSVVWQIDNAGGNLRIFQPNSVKLAIDSAGNVGVGTGSPRTRLDVAGPIASNGSGFVSDLGGAHVGYNTYWAPGWTNLDAANPGMFVRFDQNSAVLYYATAAASPAITMKGGWNSYGDVFYQLGRVGIGTGGPVEALDVVGNARLSGTLIVNGAVAIDSNGVAAKSYYAP